MKGALLSLDHIKAILMLVGVLVMLGKTSLNIVIIIISLMI